MHWEMLVIGVFCYHPKVFETLEKIWNEIENEKFSAWHFETYFFVLDVSSGSFGWSGSSTIAFLYSFGSIIVPFSWKNFWVVLKEFCLSIRLPLSGLAISGTTFLSCSGSSFELFLGLGNGVTGMSFTFRTASLLESFFSSWWLS